MQWFAVMTKPRSEALGLAHLQRQGFECRLPRVRRERRTRDGVRESLDPLFPRYLFLHADPARDEMARIRSTRGICGLVRFGTELARIPDRVIDAIAARSDAAGLVVLEPPVMRAGDCVHITGGALAGLHAIFQARTAAERVMLLVELLGAPCSVTVPVRHLAARF